jgi:hypothetical protein
MGSLFSPDRSGPRRSISGAAPPPPAPGGSHDDWLVPDPSEQPSKAAPKSRASGRPFEAELDVTELDERERPGHTWTARAREISRSSLVLRSRRMCYTGRSLLVAVHLIDDRPVPLFGRVAACDYDGDGMYRVDVDLLPVPEHSAARAWLAARARN